MADSKARPNFLRAMPVLQVVDVLTSVDFYTNVLRFTSHGIWGDPPGFCIVQRGAVTIALDRARDGTVPLNQYWAAYVYASDIDALCEAFRAKGVEIVRGPDDMDYGCRDFDVRDPDGHLIAFGEDCNPGKGDRPGLA